MALVAYENSDSSDYEEEDNNDTAIALLNNKTAIKHGNNLFQLLVLSTTCKLDLRFHT